MIGWYAAPPDMRSLFLDYECSMVTSSGTEVAWIAWHGGAMLDGANTP